jgi:RNA polymerase sigma factor (sigma-70 family)
MIKKLMISNSIAFLSQNFNFFYIWTFIIFSFLKMNDSLTDPVQLLWQSFLKGDDRSFAAIYQHFGQGLLSYGCKFNVEREMVKDALQEVFTDLYLKRNHLHVSIDNLKGYLFTALKNNLLKKILKKKKTGFDAIEMVKPELRFEIEYSFQEQLIQMEISKETTKKLHQAIDALSSKQKEIIFLKFEEELDYREIAAILNITVESARKQLYRALKSLRELLDPKTIQLFLHLFSKK